MKKILVTGMMMLAVVVVHAEVGHRVAGSGLGGPSPFATDAYPGFEGLDDMPKPEKKTTSWFLSVSRDTAAEQLLFARQELAAGNIRTARRACDALVREWPASPEAPIAQLELARILENYDKDYEEAFEAYDYLLDFYPRACDYEGIIEHQYDLADQMIREPRTFLGFSLQSSRVMRQHYEMIVRRAPGAAYVPEAMMKIAGIREKDDQYEEAVEVYGGLANRFPMSSEAREAEYLNARARMWLARRLAYNVPRCRDTVNFINRILKEQPDHKHAGEMRTWKEEVLGYLAEDAYRRAKFYDSNQRTPHAAIASWREYLKAHPDSEHAEEIKARIEELERK